MSGRPLVVPLLLVLALPVAAAHGLDDGHGTDSSALAVPFAGSGSEQWEDAGLRVEVDGVALLLAANATHLFVEARASEPGWLVLAAGPGHVELVDGPGGAVVETHYAAIAAPARDGELRTGDLGATQPAAVEGHALEIDADPGLRFSTTRDPRPALAAAWDEDRTRLWAELPFSWLALEPRRALTIAVYTGSASEEPPESVDKAQHQRFLGRAVVLGPDDDPALVEATLLRGAVPWGQALVLVALPLGAFAIAARGRPPRPD